MKAKESLHYAIEPEKYLFGICETFDGAVDKEISPEQTVELVGNMGFGSMRLWMHHKNLLKSDEEDNVFVKPEQVKKYHGYIDGLIKRGVKHLVSMNHSYLYPASFTGDRGSECEIPLPGTECYLSFLQMIEKSYEAISREFPEIPYFEVGNEVNMHRFICKQGFPVGKISEKEYDARWCYTKKEKAEITADICYYATRGVQKGNPSAYVVLPAPTPYFGYTEVRLGRRTRDRNRFRAVHIACADGRYPSEGEGESALSSDTRRGRRSFEDHDLCKGGKEMKKLLILALCAAFVFALAGCEEGKDYPEGGYAPSENTCTNKGTAPSEKGENVAVNDDQIALLEVEDLLKLTPQKMLGCDGFDIEKFTSPFYNSQIQYCEGFFLLENEDGGIDPVELAFPAAKILEVRSNDLSVLYEEGRDYILNDNGSLTIPAGSGISALSRNEFFVSSGQWSEDGKPVINTTDAMYRGQYVVTYIRTEGYDGTKANHGRSALTTFASATDAGEEINVLVLGDSIAAGAGVKDFPNWANMTKQGIEYYSQSTVNLSNAAVPGIHTGEYVGLIDGNIQLVSESIRADAQAKFALAEEVKADTDLVIIAIGGNDAGGWCGPNGTAVSTYKANVETMIEYVRAASPDCSVLLVSCMQTNPKISDSNSGNKLAAASFSEYENALSQIAEATANCALANVYGVESSLLVYKNIEDMLGDNINHPSDYMSRIYTQVVLSALFDL